MRSPDSSQTADADAESAFSLLADDTRLAILRVLAETPNGSLSFSELREAVGVTDSGRFNYHLGKLTDLFVKKTDEGYQIRLAGWNVVSAVRAGAYTRGDDVGPIPLDVPCPHCDGTVVATYADERVTIRCADCDEKFSSAGIPPGVFEGYDDEEIPLVTDRYMRSLVGQSQAGFCVSCHGRVEPGLLFDPGTYEPGDDCSDLQMTYDCTRCSEEVNGRVSMAFLQHPAVVSFYYDHGVDLTEPFLWGTAWREQPAVTVESTDPVRVRIDFELDGDVLSLVFDDAVSVRDVVPPADG